MGISTTAGAWTLIGGGIDGWQRSVLTVGVNYAGCTISNAALDDAIDAAIEQWNSVPTSSIRLERGTSSTSVATFMADAATDAPLILCDPNFSSTLGVDPDFIPGSTVRMAANPALYYGGILLNAEGGTGAEISNLSDFDLKILLTHELGHLLGLGHSSEPRALMYYSISGKTEIRLIQDDADGLSFLYPRNEFSEGAFGCSAVHPARPLRPGFLGLVGLWAAFSLGIGRLLSRRTA